MVITSPETLTISFIIRRLRQMLTGAESCHLHSRFNCSAGATEHPLLAPNANLWAVSFSRSDVPIKRIARNGQIGIVIFLPPNTESHL